MQDLSPRQRIAQQIADMFGSEVVRMIHPGTKRGKVGKNSRRPKHFYTVPMGRSGSISVMGERYIVIQVGSRRDGTYKDPVAAFAALQRL
jgi:hypothetical protein